MGNNKQLINWNYYEGKTFMELDPLAKSILRTLKFDWIMRPVSPDSRTEYKFVWRFGQDNVGYLLEADMLENGDAYALIKASRLNSKDVLHRLTSPFRVCNDQLGDDAVFGEYKG